MKESLTNPPILFIAQANEELPSLKAQSYYYHQHKSEEISSELEVKETGEEDSLEEKKTSRFHDKSMDEKLTYLTESTGILPKLKCKIITKETSYHCTIDSFDESSVVVHLTNLRRKIRLNKEEIQEILLVGF